MALIRIWLMDSRSLRNEVSRLAVSSIMAIGTRPHAMPTNFRVFARSRKISSAVGSGGGFVGSAGLTGRSEEHTSELQSQSNLVCRLLLEKKKKKTTILLCSEIHAADATT